MIINLAYWSFWHQLSLFLLVTDYKVRLIDRLINHLVPLSQYIVVQQQLLTKLQQVALQQIWLHLRYLILVAFGIPYISVYVYITIDQLSIHKYNLNRQLYKQLLV